MIGDSSSPILADLLLLIPLTAYPRPSMIDVGILVDCPAPTLDDPTLSRCRWFHGPRWDPVGLFLVGFLHPLSILVHVAEVGYFSQFRSVVFD